MKTKLITLLILSHTAIAFSQSDITKINSTKVKIGLYILPEMNTLNFQEEAQEQIGNQLDIYMQNSKSKIGISAGVNFEYHLTKKTSVRTGLGFGQKNYSHTKFGQPLGYSFTYSPRWGYPYGYTIESNVKFSEFQVPFIFQHEIIENRFFIAAGIEINYQFSNNSLRIIYDPLGNTQKMVNLNENVLNFAPTLSIGYKVNVSDKLSISIEPMLKYYLKEYIIINSHLYNYGLKTTFNFKI